MKNHIKFLLFAISLIATVPTFAANQCTILFEDVRPGAATRSNTAISLATARKTVDKLKTIEFTDKEVTAIKPLVSRMGLREIDNTNRLATALREKIEAGTGDALAKSSKYAVVSGKIYDVLEKRLTSFFKKKRITREENNLYSLTKEDATTILKEKNPDFSEAQLKEAVEALMSEYNSIKLELLRAKFAFAENITRIEEYKLREFKTSSTTSLNTPGYVIVSLSEYPEFAMALAKNKQPPRAYGSGGILSYEAYRDIVSSNMWLLTLQGHDLKHIHFANSHPMAAATLFRNTRSKNHLRYVLISGCFEGVDTVQYSWESSIARHYSSKGYSLEHAMLDIATMPTDKLEALASQVGITADHFDNWKPTKSPREVLPDNVNVASEFENDILKFITKSLTDLANPRINIYMRPEMIPEDIEVPAGTSMKPGEVIHHW